jgi:hypothetical protein
MNVDNDTMGYVQFSTPEAAAAARKVKLHVFRFEVRSQYTSSRYYLPCQNPETACVPNQHSHCHMVRAGPLYNLAATPFQRKWLDDCA